MSGDDNLYLICRQNQYLTLPLHCNTYHMEHLDHKNLFLCVFSTFSTCHQRACLRLLLVLSPVFQTAVTRFIPNLFILRHSLYFLRDIEWHCIGRVFIVLWHTITKYIFTRLDKQWCHYSIASIAYNITTLLHGTLSDTTNLFTSIVNISVICLCP